jgi:hypothetical protein
MSYPEDCGLLDVYANSCVSPLHRGDLCIFVQIYNYTCIIFGSGPWPSTQIEYKCYLTVFIEFNIVA